jgi:hypothetical protein
MSEYICGQCGQSFISDEGVTEHRRLAHGIGSGRRLIEPSDGGSAFPAISNVMGQPTGMSLRDWFAGNAMNRMQQEFKEERYPILAAKAYALADAMIEARKQ